jgi:aryl sulfotransferase
VDFRVGSEDRLAMLEAQEHRRFLKTHLPVEALGIDPSLRYIYLARDGRDAVWSYHNHFMTLKADRLAAINDAPGRVGPPLERPPESVLDFYRIWFERDGHPYWPFWDHLRGWWAIRDRPEVLLLHFEELRRDLPGSVRRIASFLGIPPDEARLPAILEHCSFDWMKAHAARVAPGRGVGWEDGGASFIHKGTNGRWRDVLPPEDCAAYEARALAELGPDCARWLATGER